MVLPEVEAFEIFTAADEVDDSGEGEDVVSRGVQLAKVGEEAEAGDVANSGGGDVENEEGGGERLDITNVVNHLVSTVQW